MALHPSESHEFMLGEPLGLLDRLPRFLKFAIVGGSGVVVNLGVFQIASWTLTMIAADATRFLVANVAGVVVSIFTNFLLNDGWTWGDRDKGEGSAWFRRLVKYYITCSVSAGIQLGVAYALRWFLLDRMGWHVEVLGRPIVPILCVLVGIVAGIAVNFPISHLWAFRDAEADDA